MKKEFKFYAIAWAIALVIFNAAAFLLPWFAGGVKFITLSFWVGYISIAISFVGHLVCAAFAFRAKNADKTFLRLQIVKVSYAGLVAMIIAGAISMFTPVTLLISAVLCFMIFAFTAAAVVIVCASSSYISKKDDEIKAKTFFIKSLYADAEHLVAQAKTPAMKEQAKRVYVAIRYSDPMNTAALAEYNEKIEREFGAFNQAFCDGDETLAAVVADSLLVVLDGRNKKCKLLK